MAITLNGSGQVIVQIVQAELPSTYSFNSTSFVAISGMTASITPTSASNKILMMVSLGRVTDDNGGTTGLAFQFVRNGTPVGIGNAASTRLRATFGALTFSDSNHGGGMSFSYIDSPATTSSITYSLYGAAVSGTAYINRTPNDYDNTTSYAARTDSTIILMEISG